MTSYYNNKLSFITLAEKKMKIMSILKLVTLLFAVLLLQLFVNGAVGCFENERHALLQLKASLVLYDTSLLLI